MRTKRPEESKSVVYARADVRKTRAKSAVSTDRTVSRARVCAANSIGRKAQRMYTERIGLILSQVTMVQVSSNTEETKLARARGLNDN